MVALTTSSLPTFGEDTLRILQNSLENYCRITAVFVESWGFFFKSNFVVRMYVRRQQIGRGRADGRAEGRGGVGHPTLWGNPA